MKNRMRISTMAVAAVLMVALGACGGADKSSVTKRCDLGTGMNTVDRQYAKSTPDTWDVALWAVKAYDLKVESDQHDAMGGDLLARRANGEKVVIRVRSLDDKTSDVSVRVEPGNRNMAEMLQDKIAEKLGIKEAK